MPTMRNINGVWYCQSCEWRGRWIIVTGIGQTEEEAQKSWKAQLPK